MPLPSETPPVPAEREIFAAVAALPDEERAAYLDLSCEGCPELRGRVEAWLSEHESNAFMETVVDESRVHSEQAGDRIGRYKLLQQIGEGGFGTAWMAEQVEPVSRRVALKFIKLGMDTREVIARSFTSVGGIPRRGLARLHADGTLDETFAPFMSTENGHGFFVSHMFVQLDGKILVGGSFNSAAGVPRNNIALLEANGSLDLSFNPDAGGSVYSMAVQVDGKVLVAGGFTGIGGTTRRYAARTRPPGSLSFSRDFTHVQSP